MAAVYEVQAVAADVAAASDQTAFACLPRGRVIEDGRVEDDAFVADFK
jgi:hypothetical protein